MIDTYTFRVNTIESGQRRPYGDSFYHYEVESNKNEHTVKDFCMNVLKKSYEKKDMPNPFAGELIEFSKRNEDGHIFYIYKVKELYTG